VKTTTLLYPRELSLVYLILIGLVTILPHKNNTTH